MSMAVCLAVYALALSVLAPPLLLRANLHGAAPASVSAPGSP